MASSLEPTFPFLCVCGQTIDVNAQKGGTCAGCGRSYSPQAINASMTVSMGAPIGFEPSDDDDMIGEALDHFTITDRLGGGGMGTVYRAMDESLQRYVALKVLRRTAKADHDAAGLERLLEEARAQARVNHPHVVHIYFVSRDQSRPYLAMELVAGKTLAQRLDDGPLPFREIVPLGLQIARALQASTEFDIVHGDIKPSNILIQNDVAKLSDFGLASRLSENEQDGRVVGTPNYMSPESCRGEVPTAQSDMYSFGVMLFEMTFGRLPYSFDSDSLSSRLEAHQHQPPEFPETWPAEVPEGWRRFLKRLLAKNPSERFESWTDLIAVMERLQPLDLVAAGTISRGLAWFIDLMILALAQGMVISPFLYLGENYFPNSSVLAFVALLSLLLPPAAAMWWASYGGSSIGKIMMQLQIVDLHGLRPRPRILARRSILQYLPIWTNLLYTQRSEGIGMPEWLAISFGTIVFGFVFCDVLFALFRRGGRSIHDRIFGTQVVLQSR